MLRTLAMVAVAVSSAAAIAFAQDKADPEKGCDGSTYEMVECLKKLTANWDSRLNAGYAATLKAAQPKQREQLRTAQRLWVQYRDANCLYWRLGEGTIAAIEAADCMYRMTRTRAEELEGAAERN